METHRLREPAKTLVTKISRQRALGAAVGGAGDSASDSLFSRRALPIASAAADPITEAGRRLTAAVEYDQVPLPRVRLMLETDGEGPRP
jgi:hypothetical protein